MKNPPMKKFDYFLKKDVNEQDDLELDSIPEIDAKNDNSSDIVKPLASMRSEVNSEDNNSIFMSLMEFHLQVRAFHWAAESLAQHTGAGITYDSINEILDTLVEAYQGYEGRIRLGGNYTILNFQDVNIDPWLGGIVDKIKKLRDNIQYSDVQNILDELLGAISKFKYLLTLK